MATTTTYSLEKPTVGGDENTWGGALNDNADKIDDLLDGTLAIKPNLDEGLWEVGGVAVTATAAELNILDGATVTTTELNYLSGVTSAVQTQFDAKADDVNASIATSISLTGAASDWQFALSGNNLVIKYGATTLAVLDTSGNLTVKGDVTALGSI